MVRRTHPTKTRILQAAAPLFASHGYSGVTMRDIAKAAQVNLGQLPYHFGTKDLLYRAIWKEWTGEVDPDELGMALGPATDLSTADRLRKLVMIFFDGPGQLLRDDQGRHFADIMVREANDPMGAERGLIGEFLRPNGDAFQAVLKSILPDLSPRLINAGFEMMVSALRVTMEAEHLRKDGCIDVAGVEAQFEELADFVVGGFMAWLRPPNVTPC